MVAHAGSCILYVDSHAETLEATARGLRLQGHLVVTADDCADALKKAHGVRFDVLIADLPEHCDGWDLLREIRSLYPIRGIAVSPGGSSDDAPRALPDGYDLHLARPVDLSRLCDALDLMANGAPAALSAGPL